MKITMNIQWKISKIFKGQLDNLRSYFDLHYTYPSAYEYEQIKNILK